MLDTCHVPKTLQKNNHTQSFLSLFGHLVNKKKAASRAALNLILKNKGFLSDIVRDRVYD